MIDPAGKKSRRRNKVAPSASAAALPDPPTEPIPAPDPSGSDEAVRITMNCRRVLSMVQELHRRGYERLRIAPSMSPSGVYWRCSIVPVARIRRDHGAEAAVPQSEKCFYGSGQYERFFDWPDAERDSTTALADKFLQRFPDLAAEGKGEDPDYVRWYDEMLRLTAPRGVVYAFADWTVPDDRLPVAGDEDANEVMVPLPPPGAASDPRE